MRACCRTDGRGRRQRAGAALAAGVVIAGLLLAPGCAPLQDVVLPTVQPAPTYDRLYPLYVELCAVSQIRAKFAEEGGSPGHAVMWLKGVCRDETATYPRLKLCEPGSIDLDDPENGVGVSVNKVLKNANWLLIPGRSLFFHGNLAPDQVLDAEHGIATIEDAHRKGVFDLVRAHERYVPPEQDREAMLEYLAKETLGTDFALNFGRTIVCDRLPVTEPMMEEVIGYLNALNEDYADGETEYNWSGYSDNCVHAVTNALAAADILPPKSVNLVKFLQLFHLAIPANEVVNLAFRVGSTRLEDWFQVYNDHRMRDSLEKYSWLPMRQGSLITVDPVHQNNELYDTRFRILLLQGPITKPKSRRMRKMVQDPAYTEIEANLRFYQERYEKILADRPTGRDTAPTDSPLLAFRDKYYVYIEEQLRDVKNKLLLVPR